MTNRSSLLGLVVTLAGLTVIAFMSLNSTHLSSALSHLPIYDQLNGHFQLQSTQEIDSLSDAKNKVALLSFGFTSCVDICPMMMHKYAGIYTVLDQKRYAQHVEMFFVSVDPKRDTIDVLNQYTKKFDTRIIGLTGLQKEIDELQKNLAVESFPMTGDHQFSHSDRIFVFDYKSRLRATASLSDSVQEMVETIESLIEEGEAG